MATLNLLPIGDYDVTLYKYPDSGYAYEKVDEFPSVETTDYLYGARTVKYALFNMQDLPSDFQDSYIINSITLKGYFDGYTTTEYMRFRLKINSNDYYSSPVVLSTSYTWYENTWTTNPDTGQPWTKTDINNLIAGFEMWGTSSSASPRCFSFGVVVDYSPPVYSKSFLSSIVLKLRATKVLSAGVNFSLGQSILSKVNLLKRTDRGFASSLSLIFRKFAGVISAINLTERYLWINGLNLENLGFFVETFGFERDVSKDEDINGNEAFFYKTKEPYIVVRGTVKAKSRVQLDAMLKNLLALIYDESSYPAIIMRTSCIVYPIDIKIKEIKKNPYWRDVIITYQVSREVF